MSESDTDAHPDADAAAPAPAPPPTGAARLSIWSAAVLIAVVAVVGIGLGYALDALLPSLRPPAASHGEFAALATRVETLEERLGALDRIAAGQKSLTQRLDRLDATIRETEPAKAGSQQLANRLDGVEKQIAALGDAGNAAAKLQRELARLAGVAEDLDHRLTAVEKQLKSQAGAGDGSTPMLLAVLQIGAAIAAERPFPTEFAALQALAKDRPDLAAAIAPLAPAAQNGVPSRAALRQGLDALADRIAAAPPASGQSWQAQTLARLRGLVTIRRIDDAGVADAAGPQAAVAAGRHRFEDGDLAGAVAALQPLTGDAAAAAQPWLRQARERLSVEGALARLQVLATPPARPPS